MKTDTVDLTKPFIIVSADTVNSTEAEKARNREQLVSLARANGYTVEQAVGSWCGEIETSFLIGGSPNKRGHCLHELGKMLSSIYHQAAHIIYDGHIGYIVGQDGTPRKLGQMKFAGNPFEAYTQLSNGQRIHF